MKIGWTFPTGRPFDSKGVYEGESVYCPICMKPTVVKIVRWEENGIKYGRATNTGICEHCGYVMKGVAHEKVMYDL